MLSCILWIAEIREGKRLENKGGAGLWGVRLETFVLPTLPIHKNMEVLPEIHSKMW
jgi:hypothetical protein